MNLLKAAIELNLTPTKFDMSNWEITKNSRDYVELMAYVDDRCPQCGAFYDLEIAIFKNEGEHWGCTIGTDTNEIGDREYLNPNSAFMAIIEELSVRGQHRECAA